MKRNIKIIASYIDSIMPAMMLFFKELTFIRILILFIIFVGVGQFINYFQSFYNFHIYQILVISTIIIASLAIKNFLKGIETFNQMIASHPIKFIGQNILDIINSKWSFPGLIIIGGLYVFLSIRLEYIKLNIIGLYVLIMIILMMVTAILTQTVYVYYLILLKKLATYNKEFKYNFYLPAKTEWVLHLAKEGRKLNNLFFILGFIYTLVYYLNMPPNAIVLRNNISGRYFWEKIQISTPDNTIFVMGWIVIFIIIVVAFPTYYYIQQTYMRMVVQKLKNKSLTEIQQLMKATALTNKDDIDLELKFITLMKDVDNSSNIAIPKNNLIPLMSSIGSLFIHLIKISESLL